MTDEQLLEAVRANWDVLEAALGDARAYRIDDGSDEPSDLEWAKRYERTADELGMLPNW